MAYPIRLLYKTIMKAFEATRQSGVPVPSLCLALGGSQPLRILHATFSQCHAPRTSSLPHAHDVYHIVLYEEGIGRAWIGGESTIVQPGVLCWSGPGDVHDYVLTGQTKCRYHELTFMFAENVSATESTAPPFDQLFTTLCGQPMQARDTTILLNDGSLEEGRHLFAGLLDVLTPLQDRLQIGARLLPLLEWTCRMGFTRTESFSRPEQRLRDAKALINSRYRERITISDLAALVHCSTPHFQRLFRQAFGISPNAYQQTLRIAAAKTLLTSTNLRCKEIAELVGFSDVYSFSRAFKAAAGIPPSSYREDKHS